MSLTKTLEGPATLKPGGTVTYELKPGCSSIETPCTNAVLVDSLPEPLVLQSISYIGFENTVTQKDPDNKTRIELAFNEKTGDVDGVGLNDGADYTVKIVAMLPADVSPELGGTKLTNSASLTSDAGSVTDEAEPVTLEIDPAPKAEITKAWAEKALLAGSGAANTVTLGGIKNASKVGATSLTILEPSGGTKPFDAVSFTGFGAVEFPAGADQIQVNYFVNGTKTDGTPGALPVIPDGMALSTITGFEFVFTSSKSTSSKGGITAGGSAGSIKLNTELRPSALVGDVNNQVSITAQTPKGDSAPKPATDKFVVDAVDYKVDAKKSFAPKKVVAENATHIGAAQNRSTVTIGATNSSNQPLKALSIKEPATGTAPFGDGIDFEKFVSSDWPTGAETGGITIAGTRYELERVDEKITFPADMPAGKDLKSFELSFEGTFAPNQGVELKFDVLGRKAGSHKNEIQAGGLTPGGVAATTDNAEDTLIVEDPKELFDGGKSFHHNRVEGLAGDTTSATLNTSVDPGTNVDVRKIVQTDMFDGMIADWKPTKVKITNNQGAASVLIEYMDAVGDWQTLADADGNLPADSKGVRITYTRASGTFPDANTGVNYGNVTSVIDFELKHDVATDKTEWTNILRTADGSEFPATVTVDKKIQLGSSKSWSAGTIVQKPSNKFPASQLRLSAWNTSTYAVDSLTLADPIGAAKPFDYVTITGMHKANLSDSSSVETARLTLTMDGGATCFSPGPKPWILHLPWFLSTGPTWSVSSLRW